MNRTILFDSPFLLGFDHTRALIERAAKAAAEGYPPYNVEERAEGCLRITLAVAGFSPEQLSVTVEDNQLVVFAPGHRRPQFHPQFRLSGRDGGPGCQHGAWPAPYRSKPPAARKADPGYPHQDAGLNRQRA